MAEIRRDRKQHESKFPQEGGFEIVFSLRVPTAGFHDLWAVGEGESTGLRTGCKAELEAQLQLGLLENIISGQTRKYCPAEGILPVPALTLDGRENKKSLSCEFLIMKLYLFTCGPEIYTTHKTQKNFK